MRIRFLAYVTTILLAGTAWAGAPVCPAECEPNGCPPECCVPQQGGLLVYECAASGQPHFVINDGQTTITLTEVSNVNASFSVAGVTVHTTIGNTTFDPFTIGSSESRVRFITSNGGQCVQVKNLSGFHNPSPIVVQNRALTVQSKAFYCQDPGGDIICFSVKGQVGAPFPDLGTCNPDRVEYACGIVS